MWRFLQAMLTGEITDPVFLLLGAAGTLVVFVTLGGIVGSIIGVVRGKVGIHGGPLRHYGPWVCGLLFGAALMGIGVLMSTSALTGLSSWLVSVAASLSSGLGWWVGYTGVTDYVPAVQKRNPFENEASNPFGVGPSNEDWMDDEKNP